MADDTDSSMADRLLMGGVLLRRVNFRQY